MTKFSVFIFTSSKPELVLFLNDRVIFSISCGVKGQKNRLLMKLPFKHEFTLTYLMPDCFLCKYIYKQEVAYGFTQNMF